MGRAADPYPDSPAQCLVGGCGSLAHTRRGLCPFHRTAWQRDRQAGDRPGHRILAGDLRQVRSAAEQATQIRRWAATVPEPPTSYFRRSVYGCFSRDRHGIDSIEPIGVDNVLFETDYPHTDSTWPDTLDMAPEHFAGVPADVVYKISRGNAITLYGLDI